MTDINDFGMIPLQSEIKDGKLVISIGIDTLAFATVECSEQLGHDFKVDLVEGFAKDVLNELTRESEDGSTIITRMFDAGALEAIEQGCEYVTELEDKDIL